MPFHVLTAEISHETNTFNVRPTDLRAFRDRYLLDGPTTLAARGDANTELAGLLDVARRHGWDVIHTGSAAAGPGGRVTDPAFDALCAPLPDAAARGGWDGVLLMLHGAMVSVSHDDGEGEILRRLRGVVGPDMPVAVTLDPHANVGPAMCARAQILVSYTTYPHVDIRATGRRAAELLHRAMAGEVRPATPRAHRPMLEEANGGRTDLGPMIERHAFARAAEARRDILAVSIDGGFPCADVAFAGPTVLVTHDLADEGPTPPQDVAEEIADDIWELRHDALNAYLSVDEAAALAADWAGGEPLVIADYADNPGSGAYGDPTALLAALIDGGVARTCFGPMIDAPAARALQSEAIGATVTLALGGRTAPEFGGGALEVTGEVRWLGEGLVTGTGPILGRQQRDFGATAVLRIVGIDVLIVSIAHQMIDLAQFETFGVDPRTCACIALRSMQHFRAAFAPIAGRIVVCDSGALLSNSMGFVPERRVAARRVAPAFDELGDRHSGLRFGEQPAPGGRRAFERGEGAFAHAPPGRRLRRNLPGGASSQASATEPIDGRMPASVKRRPNDTDVRRDPRSPWWMTCRGRRWPIAGFAASLTSRTSRSRPIDRPTMRRDRASGIERSRRHRSEPDGEGTGRRGPVRSGRRRCRAPSSSDRWRRRLAPRRAEPVPCEPGVAIASRTNGAPMTTLREDIALQAKLAVLLAKARRFLALGTGRAVIPDTAVDARPLQPARDGRGARLERPRQALDTTARARRRDDPIPKSEGHGFLVPGTRTPFRNRRDGPTEPGESLAVCRPTSYDLGCSRSRSGIMHQSRRTTLARNRAARRKGAFQSKPCTTTFISEVFIPHRVLRVIGHTRDAAATPGAVLHQTLHRVRRPSKPLTARARARWRR